MFIIKAMTAVALIFLFAGCASIKKTTYFEPEKIGNGWTKVNNNKLLVFGEIPDDITYKCGDTSTSITFQSTSLKTFAMSGPVVIPFPFPGGDETVNGNSIIDFNIYSENTKTKLIDAVIMVNDTKIQPNGRLMFELEGTSIYRYSYDVNWKYFNTILFQIETNDSSCGILSVPYTKRSHFTYSILFG